MGDTPLVPQSTDYVELPGATSMCTAAFALQPDETKEEEKPVVEEISPKKAEVFDLTLFDHDTELSCGHSIRFLNTGCPTCLDYAQQERERLQTPKEQKGKTKERCMGVAVVRCTQCLMENEVSLASASVSSARSLPREG